MAEPRLWAKLSKDGIGWHSLVDHSADVAAVLMALLDQPTIAERLARLGGSALLTAGMRARLGALAFLHDLGKANSGFQARCNPAAPPVGHIDQVAWLFNNEDPDVLARVGQSLGLQLIEPWFSADSAMEWLAAVMAHHGRPWNLGAPPESSTHWRATPTANPIADLSVLRDALQRWFAPAFAPHTPLLPASPGMIHGFAGLLMLADWLGSDASFRFANGLDLDRWPFAQETAAAALREIGLDVGASRRSLRTLGASFADAFGFPPTRPIQQMVTLPTAQLLVLESETGSGKTEAALWRFAHLFAAGLVDGLYFALPTRVAASQLHARVMRFRDHVFGPEDRPGVVLAVPGQARVDHAGGRSLPDFGFEWSDNPDGGAQRARWAAEHPKRFLAAQIAVGTIDQVLLGAVRVKHAHLRSSALLRLLLVVDEVHASDAYMGHLLGEVLRFHVAAGGHALLLSATLGGALRARLLGTRCPDFTAAVAMPYPMLSWSESGVQAQLAVPSDHTAAKPVTLEPLPIQSDPDAVAALAFAAALQGAAVLVVRNTVAAAVETAQAIEALAGHDSPLLFRVGAVATLHHGRFGAADRLLLDQAVEQALGRNRAAGGRIVVGTQTLEQSLDLDADLLLTDLCPADVLLQRIGRLHRHRRDRPSGFQAARVVVLVPGATGCTTTRSASTTATSAPMPIYASWR